MNQSTTSFVLNVASEWQMALAEVDSPYTMEVDLRGYEEGLISRMMVFKDGATAVVTSMKIGDNEHIPETMAAQLRFIIAYLELHEPNLKVKL